MFCENKRLSCFFFGKRWFAFRVMNKYRNQNGDTLSIRKTLVITCAFLIFRVLRDSYQLSFSFPTKPFLAASAILSMMTLEKAKVITRAFDDVFLAP